MKKILLTLIFISTVNTAFAKAGAYVNVKNQCHYPVRFSIGNDNLSVIHKTIDVPSLLIKKFTYLEDTSSGIGVESLTNDSSGSLIFWLHDNIAGNYLNTRNIKGIIDIDVKYKKWHNFNGTPTFTIISCPKNIEIDKSDMMKNVQRVIIFGDSLSDKGTLNEYTQGIIPKSTPYYNGMFSNGPVWAFQFKNDLKQKGIEVSNYSVGGATTVFHLGLNLPYSIGGEYEIYRFNSFFKFWNNEKNQLAIIFIGANDYLDASNDLTEIQTQQLTSAVVDSIKGIAKKLIDNGVRKFVFIGLPNLGKSPESQFDQKNYFITDRLTKAHNRKLMTMVENFKTSFEKTDLQFQLISVDYLFNMLVNNTDEINHKYGLIIDKNKNTSSCWKGGYTSLPITNNPKVNQKLLIDRFASNTKSNQSNVIKNSPNTSDVRNAIIVANSGKLCSDPEHYIFWDRVHPTAQIQNMIYDYIKEQLDIQTKDQ